MQRSTRTPPTAAITGHGERRPTRSRTTSAKTSHAPSTTARCTHERNEVCTARVATSRAAGTPIMSQRSSGSIPSVDSRARHGRVDASHEARAAGAPGRRTSRVRAAIMPMIEPREREQREGCGRSTPSPGHGRRARRRGRRPSGCTPGSRRCRRRSRRAPPRARRTRRARRDHAS